MMKLIVDLKEEIKGVHEENRYLISRADRTMKDVLMDQLAKAETKVQELHERLVSVKDSIKQMAKDTVDKMKQLGDKALFKVIEFTHFGELLDGIRKKAEKTLSGISDLSDRVRDYKKTDEIKKQDDLQSKTEENMESQDSVYAVAEEPIHYQAEPVGTFEEEVQKFMADRVSEGVTYECNQDAYEDFKAYYDKKLKAAGQAGKGQMAVQREMEHVAR